MAYPEIKYKGQHTLKRTLTVPATASILNTDIGKLVTFDATGILIIAPADTPFFGILRAINTNDNVATVDFSGVHEMVSSGVITAGQAVIPVDGDTVKADGAGATAVAITKAVALVTTVDTEKTQIFFLN